VAALVSRREEILAAALDVVRSGEPEAISMRPVADRVGITATALYRHFRDKDDLVRCAVGYAEALLRERLDRAAKAPASAEARLWATLQEIARFAVEDPRVYAFLTAPSHGDSGGSVLRAVEAPRDDSLLGRLRARVVAWMTESGVRGDPTEITLVLLAQTHGLTLLWMRGHFDDGAEFADFFRKAFFLLLSGVGKS
jgi:AcrR family transcriptional regulator